MDFCADLFICDSIKYYTFFNGIQLGIIFLIDSCKKWVSVKISYILQNYNKAITNNNLPWFKMKWYAGFQ